MFDGKLKWISEPDTGIYNAMNKGIFRSTGEIIGIVNVYVYMTSSIMNIDEVFTKLIKVIGKSRCPYQL